MHLCIVLSRVHRHICYTHQYGQIHLQSGGTRRCTYIYADLKKENNYNIMLNTDTLCFRIHHGKCYFIFQISIYASRYVISTYINADLKNKITITMLNTDTYLLAYMFI